MRYKILILLVLITAAITAVASNEVLEYFNANSDGKVITIQWKALDETYISKYEIERSQSSGAYKKIYTQETNNSSYSYIDEDAYLKPNSGDNPETTKTNYTYRIKIIKKDNTYLYSTTQSVSHSINSIRRTWGMIKEMFR